MLRGLILGVWWIGLCGAPCLQRAWAAEPEFERRSAKTPGPEFDEKGGPSPSLSADGRYAALHVSNSPEHEIIVTQTADGKELFRAHSLDTGFKPTFSFNGELLATHRMVKNAETGAAGFLHQLIVYRCPTGKRVSESNLRVQPALIWFSSEWILVAGPGLLKMSDMHCQVFRTEDGSCVATLVIPVESAGLAGESLTLRRIELGATHLTLCSENRFTSFLGGGGNPPSFVTYRWDWKRVLELSQQGELILAAGASLNLLYRRNNRQADPLAEFKRLGANVGRHQVRVPVDENRRGVDDPDPFTGEWKSYQDDPAGGLAIGLSNVPLSDRELVELLKRIPQVKTIQLAHFQLTDLSPLTQFKDLETLKTSRLAGAKDLATIANMKKLKTIPWKIEGDELLAQVAASDSLEFLSLATKDVTDAGVRRIARMPSLKSIRLAETGISAQGLKELEDMPNLESVSIDFGLRADDEALKILVGSRKVQSLVLGIFNRAPSRITDAGLVSVAGVTNLKVLNLGYVPITDQGVAHLLELKKLHQLNLCGTRITDAALKDLCRLPSLAHLDISSCKGPTDAGLLELKNAACLRVLFASERDGVSKKGVTELRKLRPDLKIWTGSEF